MTVPPHGGFDALRAGFEEPSADSRPMMRWWWFGPNVERAELTRELEVMREAGLGGVEVAVVYPLGDGTDRYLSDTFLADLRFAAEEAERLGLRFDVTLGSGWPFGGPHVTPELAARGLRWDSQEIGLAAIDVPVPPAWLHDEFVAAYVGDGTTAEARAFEPVPVVDGVIRVPAGRGPRVVLTAVSRLTGQQVKRAAAGAEGPALDHYSAAATARHVEVVCEPLVAAVGAERLGSVFCDSLEVYGADWTPSVLEEFGTRRGYDALPLLWLLHVDGAGAARLRADYYSTLTELCEENFLAPLQRWASSHGVPFRLQGYGVPPASVSSYRFADIIEGEGWGWKDLPPTRWASSAAQIYGRQIVSSETWTWAHSPSFRATPLDLKAEVHEHFLCGVNHVIGHGWPYSPRDTGGLGWIFYAAGAFDERNAWWPAAPSLTKYVQRLSWLLRQGARVSDVGIYVPRRDVFGRMHRDRGRGIDLWHATREWIGFEVTHAIRDAGVDFDLFDDDAVAVLDPGRFPVVVLPSVTDLPDPTAAWLKEVERAGGRVIAATDVPDALVSPDVSLSPPCPAIGVIHRRVGDVDVYVVINAGPSTERFELTARDTHSWMEQWSPLTGAVVGRTSGPVPVTLAAYEATVLVGVDGDASPLTAATPAELVLDGQWTVRFGGDAVPVELPHRWEDDIALRHFSGSATYASTVHLDAVPGGEVWLDLGPATPLEHGEIGLRHVDGRGYRAAIEPPVGVIAEVHVNGVAAGVVWSPPYRVVIGHLLRAGANELELRVSNTTANALAADPTVPAWADAAREEYGRRFALQHLELATDGVSSGLLAVPRLMAEYT